MAGQRKEERMFFHAFCNSAVEFHVAVLCGWGKFIWVKKCLDKFTRVKYTKGFNKKNPNILAQKVSEPQFFWSWSTWKSQTEPGSIGKLPHVCWWVHSAHEVWVYNEEWIEKLLQSLKLLEDISLCIKCQPQQRTRAKTGPQGWTHLLL